MIWSVWGSEMDRIVSNARPLIYLAKANHLEVLKDAVHQILIPRVVYQEVVVDGKRLGERDAFRVDQAVLQSWIKVEQAREAYPVEIPIHPGEAEVISLAKAMGVEWVLLDDVKARTASELAGLKPIGTLGILLRAIKDGKLSFDRFLSTLEEMVRSGFYLKEDLYLRAVREANRLSGQERG